MQRFRDELGRQLSGPALPVVWAGMTLLLGLSGPLGSYENCTFAHRTLFWSVAVGSIILLHSVFCTALHLSCGRLQYRCALPLVSGVVALVLFMPLVAVAEARIVHDGPVLSASTGETLTFLFLTALGIGGYSLITGADRTPAPEPLPASGGAADSGTGDMPRLLMRIDPALRGDLLSITGRDHYVDIRTGAGASTILMRFSDAMAEAAPVAGAQVHRSHWVAWQAVAGAEKVAGKPCLVLTDGSRIPVSRSYRHAVTSRGLLRD